MLQISKKFDYAVLTLSFLSQEENSWTSLQDIAHSTGLSANFLAQIMMPLKKSELVIAREGHGGGYRLASNKQEISLYAIYTALKGPLKLVSCFDNKDSCSCHMACSTQELWLDLQHTVEQFLKNKTLADITAKKMFV